MRVLICASGTVGDVHPLVGIAGAMKARGHDVHLLANPTYAPLAEIVGVSFHPIGLEQDLAKIKNNPQAWSYQRGWKIWIKGGGVAPMRTLYAAIEKLNRPGETIVGASYLCFGAHMARDKLAIPTATLHFNVHTIRSIYGVYAFPPPEFLSEQAPQVFVLGDDSPRWCRKAILWLADSLMVNPIAAAEVDRFRRQLGLPKLKCFVRDWWNSPQRVIGLFPDWWAGDHPDWPSQVVPTGFPIWDRSESAALSDDLRRFVGEHGKVVVFSPGASSGHSHENFLAFARTCQRLGKAGVIISPRPSDSLSRSYPIRFERYVPFSRLLPHTAAIVHQAGIGTSALCLAAGVPQVVVPSLYNQPDSAIRLERLGVARRIPRWQFGEETLTRALHHVTRSPTVAESCAIYAQKMAANDPYPQICEHLESLLC